MLVSLLTLFVSHAFAVTQNEYRLATGLGASAPDVSSLVNMNQGNTPENPAGVMYQDGFRASVQIARSAGLNDKGFEGGYSGGSLGAAVGLYSPGCVDCKSRSAAVVGTNFGGKNVFVGGRYQVLDTQTTYGAGAMVNATGTHRLGISATYMNPNTPNSAVTSYTGGYGYVTKEHTFTLEMSGLKNQADVEASKLMLFGLGFQKRVESLQASVNYVRTLNSTAAVVPENFWLGVGFNSQSWNIQAYSNLIGPFMLVLSGYF